MKKIVLSALGLAAALAFAPVANAATAPTPMHHKHHVVHHHHVAHHHHLKKVHHTDPKKA